MIWAVPVPVSPAPAWAELLLASTAPAARLAILAVVALIIGSAFRLPAVLVRTAPRLPGAPMPYARDHPGTDGPRSRLPSATPPLIMPAEEFPADKEKPLGQLDRQQEACYAHQGSVLEVAVQRLPSSADPAGRY